MSAIEVEAETRSKSATAVASDLEPKSPWQTLEKYVAIDGAGGKDAVVDGSGAVAIGPGSVTKGPHTLAVGYSASAMDVNAVAFGVNAIAKHQHGVAIGTNTTAEGEFAVTMGASSTASHRFSVALGGHSKTDRENTISVGSLQMKRAIRYVADGELSAASHEAVTGGQLFVTNQKVDALKASDRYVSIRGFSDTDNAVAVAAGAIAIGPSAAANGYGYSGPIAIGYSVTSYGLAAVAIGQESHSAFRGLALGYQSRANGDNSVALGSGVAEAHRSIAIGYSSSAKIAQSLALAPFSLAGAANAVAIGVSSDAGHQNAVALGANSKTDQDNTIAVGSVEFRRAIRFVKDADLSTSSHEAVTGRQLFATNQQVGAHETAIAGNAHNIEQATTMLADLRQEVSSGSLGLVQQNGSNRKLTIGAAADGTLIDAAGIQGARRLSGLADGQDSADAVTYRQLDALRNDRLLARYDDGAREQLTFNLGGKPTRLGNVSNGKKERRGQHWAAR
jgi:autotransporter adhesin